mmetsp:Transcript_9339/g.22389  ORF Transcript_9339/g.22389 Transcript_9339/m.22389 type:complete len:212 (+) Transcript_9339:92-727(+)
MHPVVKQLQQILLETQELRVLELPEVAQTAHVVHVRGTSPAAICHILGHGLDVGSADCQVTLLEDGHDIRHDHRNVLDEIDEDHGAGVVDVIAKAYLIAHLDWVFLNIQQVLLTLGERQANLQVSRRLEVRLPARGSGPARLRGAAVCDGGPRAQGSQVARKGRPQTAHRSFQLSFGLLMAQAAHDSVMHAGEEPLLADQARQTSFAEGPV